MAESLTRVCNTVLSSPALGQDPTTSPTTRRLKTKMNKRDQKRTTLSDSLEQAEFLAEDVVEYLLKENRIFVNGYTNVLPGQLREVRESAKPSLREPTFEKARQRIAECCLFIMGRHGLEIEEVCRKVDVGVEQLHSNVDEALTTIWTEPRNWGRLVSLFVAAYYLCKRISDEDGKSSDKIRSVVGWLSRFLKQHAVPWVVERGGFVGILYNTHLPTTKMGQSEDCKSDYTKTGLFVTALGLGAAMVVGTLIGR